METKANNILIGLFILFVFIIGFAFIYYAQWRKTGNVHDYQIRFHGNVEGLSTASKVMFNGLVVGYVREIVIDQQDGRNTVVAVKIREKTPIRINSEATIKSNIVTGSSNIQISPGTPVASLLSVPDAGETINIRSASIVKKSLLQGAPDLLSNMNALVLKLTDLVSNNDILVNQAIANIKSFTETLEQGKKDLSIAMQNTRLITENINRDVNEVMTDAKVVTAQVRSDISGVMEGAKQLSSSLNLMATKVATLINTNEQTLTRTISHLESVSRSIDAKKDDIEQIIVNARNMTGKADNLALKLDKLVVDNGTTLTDTLRNLQNFTHTLENNKEAVAQAMVNARDVSEQFKSVSTKIDKMATDFSGIISTADGESIFKEIQQTIATFKGIATKLDKSFGDGSGPLAKTLQKSAVDFRLMVGDARRVLRTLNNVVEQVERHPFIGSQQVPEYAGQQ